MICEDFVMLGKSVPEPSGDGRYFVCSAGYSKDLGLMRIYPLSMKSTPKRWTKYRIALERNPKDYRRESWKIRGDRSTAKHWAINKCFHPIGKATEEEKLEILNYKSPPKNKYRNSIKYFNEIYLSLGIINPIEPPELIFKENESNITFDHPYYGSKRFSHLPCVRFIDDDPCTTPGRPFHELQLREWGIFELMRKKENGEYDIEYFSKALNLHNCPPLLVGNHNKYRASWLIIAVLR